MPKGVETLAREHLHRLINIPTFIHICKADAYIAQMIGQVVFIAEDTALFQYSTFLMGKMLQLIIYVKERADIVMLHIVRTDFAELAAVGGVFVSNRFASETDACRLVQMIVSDCPPSEVILPLAS